MASLERLPKLEIAALRDPDMSFVLSLDTSTMGPDAAMQRAWIHTVITLLYMYDELLKNQTDREAANWNAMKRERGEGT